MKKYFYPFLFLSFLLISACNKDTLNVTGMIDAELNGLRWVANGSYTSNLPLGIGVDLHFNAHNDAGLLREELFVFKVPFEKGKYNLSKASIRKDDGLVGSDYWTLSHDGDVLNDTYILIPYMENTIEITEANEGDKTIKGILNATYLIAPGDKAEVDTIRIENGMFEVTLRD